MLRMQRRGTLLNWWWECKLVQPLWKTVRRFPKKSKIEQLYDSVTPLLGIYPKDTKILRWRDTCTLMFTAVLSTTAKLWKEPKCPTTDEWIKKMSYIHIHMYRYTHTHTHTHTYNGMLLNYQKEWNLAICNNVDGARVLCWMKSVRERQRPYDFKLICGI